MRRIVMYVVIFSALCVASGAGAQTASGTSQRDDFIRVEQTGIAELPNGAAFKIFLDMAAVHAQGDRPILTDYLRKRMGLSAERAGEMAAMLLRSRESLAKELEEARLQILCGTMPGDRGRDEIYRLFGMSDDMPDVIGDKHLLIFKSQVTAEEAARLQQLLDLEKENMGRAKIDHKKLYESSGTNPNDVIADICNLAGRT